MKRITIILTALTALTACALASAALAAGGPIGTWKTRISGTKVLAGHIDGTWTIDFTHHKYTVTWNGKTVLHGDDTVKGSDMSLTDMSGKVKCPGTGKYSIKENGSKLTFKKIKDSKECAGRTAVLTTHPLTKPS
jgi:hypothetical protein